MLFLIFPQEHDQNIPLGEYVLTQMDPRLEKNSMRGRASKESNLPSSMDKDERIKFENKMGEVFESFGIPGKYHSLTPGHKNQIGEKEANELIDKHFLFNDMTTDNHLTSSGVASDWAFGRGIWISQDETKMIWVGEEDQLRIISIVQGNDLGKVDKSLHELLTGIEKSGLQFAEHPVYGVVTTCPTNMGTGKRQSILGKFPNITKQVTDEKKLKDLARALGLKARGVGGEHSNMYKEGTADIIHPPDLESLKPLQQRDSGKVLLSFTTLKSKQENEVTDKIDAQCNDYYSSYKIFKLNLYVKYLYH